MLAVNCQSVEVSTCRPSVDRVIIPVCPRATSRLLNHWIVSQSRERRRVDRRLFASSEPPRQQAAQEAGTGGPAAEQGAEGGSRRTPAQARQSAASQLGQLASQASRSDSRPASWLGHVGLAVLTMANY